MAASNGRPVISKAQLKQALHMEQEGMTLRQVAATMRLAHYTLRLKINAAYGNKAERRMVHV